MIEIERLIAIWHVNIVIPGNWLIDWLFDLFNEGYNCLFRLNPNELIEQIIQ